MDFPIGFFTDTIHATRLAFLTDTGQAFPMPGTYEITWRKVLNRVPLTLEQTPGLTITGANGLSHASQGDGVFDYSVTPAVHAPLTAGRWHGHMKGVDGAAHRFAASIELHVGAPGTPARETWMKVTSHVPGTSAFLGVVTRGAYAGQSTQSFMSAGSDAAVLAATAAAAVADGSFRVLVHKKNSAWRVAQALDGRVSYEAQSAGVVIELDPAMTVPIPAFYVQAAGQLGGGFRGLTLNTNGKVSTWGIEVGGKGFVFDASVIDDGVARTGIEGIEVLSTAEDVLLTGGWSAKNFGVNLRVRQSAKNFIAEDVADISGYADKGVQLLRDANPRGPWVFRRMGIGYPAFGTTAKQPFAINQFTATNHPMSRGLVVDDVVAILPGGAHQQGVASNAASDCFSGHNIFDSIWRKCRVYGGGELGFNLSLGGDGNVMEDCHAENCDMGGFNFGTALSPLMARTLLKGCTARNNGANVIGDVAQDRGNFMFERQSAVVFEGCTSIIDNGVTERHVIYNDCAEINESGFVMQGASAQAPRQIEGACSFRHIEGEYAGEPVMSAGAYAGSIIRDTVAGFAKIFTGAAWAKAQSPTRWFGQFSSSGVLSNGENIADHAVVSGTSVYTITLSKPLPSTAVAVQFTNRTATTTRSHHISVDSPTQITVTTFSAGATQATAAFTIEILA